jgi:hypothetical protein
MQYNRVTILDLRFVVNEEIFHQIMGVRLYRSYYTD